MKTIKLLICCLLMFGCVAGWAERNPAKAKAQAKPQSVKEITVYRSPTCSCCEKWLDHLKQNNFKVNDNIVEDVQSVKSKYGVAAEMASCHTALIDGYVVEGHVPAADIEQLVKKRPNALGIAVPGMPTGTPGMEMGEKKRGI